MLKKMFSPLGKIFLWSKFDGIAAWKGRAGWSWSNAFFTGFIEGVIFTLTKLQLTLMILSKLKIVAFAKS